MFDAQLLIAKANGGENDYIVLSPWFRRQADNAVFTGEVVELDGGQVDVTVMTKNSEDAGDGTDVSGTISLGTTKGCDDEAFIGVLEEMVRYKFTVPNGTAGNWVLFRMLPPVWFDSAEA